MKLQFGCILVLILTLNLGFNTKMAASIAPKIELDSLPLIFQIGEYSDQYEKLNSSTSTLLQTCQNDVYLAYDKWLHLLSELESTSKILGFNLSGTKFWFSVIWNQDGTIKHFAYFPKTNSKNIDLKMFKEVLIQFIENYKLPVSSLVTFSNYGSVAFPLPERNPVVRKN